MTQTTVARRLIGSPLAGSLAPFRTFDQQDSGCIAWGVHANSRRYLIKYAAYDSLDGRGRHAVRALRQAAGFHAVVSHPNIVPALDLVDLPEGVALVFPWVNGEVLSSPEWPDRRTNPASPYSRFVRLPVERKLAALDAVIDAHQAVTAAGYIAVDLYLGCVLYDFDDHHVSLIDFDHYHLGPYVLESDRQLGSRSLMPPEEFRRGALIDERATIYTIGKMALEFLGDRRQEHETWQGQPATHDVIRRATEPDPIDRYTSYGASAADWRANRRGQHDPAQTT